MQGENERQWKKSERERVRHLLHKKRLWKFHVVVVQNNGKEVYNKMVLHKMSGSEKKVNESAYDICSIKNVCGSFTLYSCKTTTKKCTTKWCCTCKVAVLLIRPIVVFHCSPALPSPVSITRFYILFEQTINIIESFTFSPWLNSG